MIRASSKVIAAMAPLRILMCLVGFCLGTCQVSEVRATFSQSFDTASETERVAPHKSGRDPHQATLADEEIQRLQVEKQQSLDRLEKTASEIARIWKEKQAKKKAGSAQPGNSGMQSGPNGTQSDADTGKEAVSSDIAQSSDSPETRGAKEEPNSGNKTLGMESATSASETGIGSTPSSNDDQNAESISSISVSNVVDGPIDRLGLATSLFATKELRECLKILEAVNLRPLSVEDRQWHDYLAASCYRDLGNRSEAAGLYRSVLQRSSSTWISSAARWWLAHIDERAQLEQKLQDVQTTISNWRKEIDALKTAN